MAGRKSLGNSVGLPHVGVRPEVAEALRHLSDSTGHSKAFLIRSAVETYVSVLGLVFPIEPVPTFYREDKKL